MQIENVPAYLFCLALFAFAGYREAVAYERESGERAWGLHPLAWMVIRGATMILGWILFDVAAKRRVIRGPQHTEWRLLRGVGGFALVFIGTLFALAGMAGILGNDDTGLGAAAGALAGGSVVAYLGVAVWRGGRRRLQGAET